MARTGERAVTPIRRTHEPAGPVDMKATLAPMVMGRNDPTTCFAADGFWRTVLHATGTATIHIHPVDRHFELTGWGEGAEAVLDLVPDWLGAADDGHFVCEHPGINELVRRNPGVRIGRTLDVMPALYTAICAQKVTGAEAKRAWNLIVAQWGDPAPGPADLRVLPPADRLANLGYYELHTVGLEKRRGDVIRRVAAAATRLERIIDLTVLEAHERLQYFTGVGPWTSNEVTAVALGDADAVSVGDFHLKNDVAWALAGRPRGTDAEMLELLEPFRGNRGRVLRLLAVGGVRAPRRGPRLEPRDIRHH